MHCGIFVFGMLLWGKDLEKLPLQVMSTLRKCATSKGRLSASTANYASASSMTQMPRRCTWKDAGIASSTRLVNHFFSSFFNDVVFMRPCVCCWGGGLKCLLVFVVEMFNETVLMYFSSTGRLNTWSQCVFFKTSLHYKSSCSLMMTCCECGMHPSPFPQHWCQCNWAVDLSTEKGGP